MLKKLGPKGAQNGTAAALHLSLALLGRSAVPPLWSRGGGVDGQLAALDKCPRCCRAYDEAIKFKRLGLERRLADADEPMETTGGAGTGPGGSAVRLCGGQLCGDGARKRRRVLQRGGGGADGAVREGAKMIKWAYIDR